MRRCFALVAVVVGLGFAPVAVGQPPRPEAQQRQTDVWTLNDQSWDFKDVLTAYAPLKGRFETSENAGPLVVWKMQLVRDMEDGAARLQEELRGSPFKIVLLDAERAVINPDVQARITPVPAKAGDVIEMVVALPDRELLKQVKYIRVQRRTDIGF